MPDPVSFFVRDTDSSRLILFIHGFGGESHATFGMLPAFLAGDPRLNDWDIACFGFPTKLAPDLTGIWQADPDLTTLTGLLTTSLSNQNYSRYSELALIAHSMGGLIVQRALANGHLGNRVKFVLLFGTPSNGLRKAGLIKLFKRQARDMTHGGAFITRLRSDWQNKFQQGIPFTFYAVAGVKDEFVPTTSSVEVFDDRYRKFVNGNHLEMVKPGRHDNDTVALIKTVLLNEGSNGIPRVDPETALQKAQNPEAQEDWGQLALKLEMAGMQDTAIRLLETRYQQSTDLAGILAGRFKRRWLADPVGRQEEGNRSYQLYKAAFEKAKNNADHEQAFYNGINQAFMELAYHQNSAGARVLAAEVLEHCKKAPPNGHWLPATEGEASLYLGNHEMAVSSYEQALNHPHPPNPREIDSMYKQAIWATRLLQNEEAEQKLQQLFAPYIIA